MSQQNQYGHLPGHGAPNAGHPGIPIQGQNGGFQHQNPNIVGGPQSSSFSEQDSAEAQGVSDESLMQFMRTLQNYEPMIPDEVAKKFA